MWTDDHGPTFGSYVALGVGLLPVLCDITQPDDALSLL
jgi:hypothetical protein